MAEEFRIILAPNFRECMTCGSVVADQKTHADWHERLREAVANGFPTVALDDLDQ